MTINKSTTNQTTTEQAHNKPKATTTDLYNDTNRPTLTGCSKRVKSRQDRSIDRVKLKSSRTRAISSISNKMGAAIQLLIVMNLLYSAGQMAIWFVGQQPDETGGHSGGLLLWADAVDVQRLTVPDLVVIDQLNQQQQQSQLKGRSQAATAATDQSQHRTQSLNLNSSHQPEAASLINSQDLSEQQQQSQITFECLISFDKRKDKNLIIKWHHDDRIEPIYQWIPELNKRSIAPQYRAYIAPIVAQSHEPPLAASQQSLVPVGQNATSSNQQTPIVNSNQIQTLEAGFRLVRPNKELGGKYTCSAISTQNDDSKWKKMIVYTPPRTFRFNASRTDIGAQLISHRERLIQLTQPAMVGSMSPAANSAYQQLPLAYRMRGLDGQQQQFGPTTISPQMYSTIDYVNVNQQRARQQQSPSSPWLVSSPTQSPSYGKLSSYSSHHLDNNQAISTRQQLAASSGRQRDNNSGSNSSSGSSGSSKLNGVKLVCDIDQVFPVPEVSIYRLAKLDGSNPDKLAKLDTRIERNSLTGLYHVQVTSIMEDDELQMKYGLNEPVYFECLIALTNLELSKYADNKRSIVYRPGLLLGSQQQDRILTSEDSNLEQVGSSADNSIAPNLENQRLLLLGVIFLLPLIIQRLWFVS